MSLNLHQLSTFCAVLNEGSMTAAAQKLFLTQPAISQQIRHLEEEIGADLLVRGVRQVRPTIQGQLLYDYARKIIQLTQQAHVAVQTVSQNVQGELRIGTLSSLGIAVVSPLVGLFLKNNSNLTLNLNYGSVLETAEAFRSEQIDVAILPDVEMEFGWSEFAPQKYFLFNDEIKLVGSGKDPQMPRQIALADLGHRPWVVSSDHLAGFEQALQEYLHASQVKLPRPVFATNNIGTLKRVVESGAGWGFLPLHSIHKQIRSGRLIGVNVTGFSYVSPIYLYAREAPELRPAVEVLHRALLQKVAD